MQNPVGDQSPCDHPDQPLYRFCDKTGKLVPEVERTFAVWLFMDDDSKMKAESKGMTEGKTEFVVVCDHLEALGNDEQNKQAAAAYAKTQIVKMDLSALGPKVPDAAAAQLDALAPEAEVEKESLDAFAGKCHKCDGVGHRQADCTSKEGINLACNICGGWGHYANDCPSREGGKGKGKGDKGKGDWGKGGKGDFGKGKGDWGKGGKGDWGKGGKGFGGKS